MTLTPSSPDLMSTRDEVLTALAKDVEIHTHNDGLQRGVVMFFKSLLKRSELIAKLEGIEGSAEAQANLNM